MRRIERRWNRQKSDEAWARLSCAFGMMGSMENDPLATYLDALARDDCYRVQRVLKQSPHETTEVVYFMGTNDARLGPFVRKRISCDAEMGKGYYHLLEAQRAGRRFLHLPRIYDVHRRDDELIVVMEFVAGRTLRDEVFACDPSLKLALRWFPLLCDGVAEMHSLAPAPLIHRDLKPDNVLVGEGQLTVLDFGIARPYRDGADSDTTHFGTRSYAPPEQFGYGQTDVRSDGYALGMILYFLLTEREPSPAVVRAGFPDPEIPPLVRGVLARACAFDPASRFQSVQELKAAFMAAAQAEMPHRAQAGQGQAAGVPLAPPSSAAFPLSGASGSEAPVAAFASPVVGTACSAASTSPNAADASSPVGISSQAPASPSTAYRASIVVGMVWNVLVLLTWGLFMLASTVAVVNPNQNDQQLPFWFLLMEYIGFFWPCFSGIAYALLDKRWLRRHIPFMKGQTFKRGLILGVILVAIGCAFMLLCVICIATGAVAYPSASS